MRVGRGVRLLEGNFVGFGSGSGGVQWVRKEIWCSDANPIIFFPSPFSSKKKPDYFSRCGGGKFLFVLI